MFESLRGLFNKYWEMKIAARGGKTSFPSLSKFETPEALFDPRKAMDIVEEAKAFIGDVDQYLGSLQWWERIILLSHHLPPGHGEGKQLSAEATRVKLRHEVDYRWITRRQALTCPPALLKHRKSILRAAQSLKEAAEAHFRAGGYIQEGWKPPTERRFGD